MKSWFDVSTKQMPIFVLFVSARVLFDGAFSLSVSLKILETSQVSTCVGVSF